MVTMVTKGTTDEHRCELPSEHVLAWLDRWDLTDTNAGKVLAVTVRTIQEWTKHGAKGAGGRHLRALVAQETSPYWLARELGVQLSAFKRSQFDRKRAAAVPQDVASTMPVKSTYRWAGRERQAAGSME
ncbi:MAG TPA: hypothetical protein VGU01_13725 [Sphingomicrobium sp.]|nr:hypothetical protein [Sphingomicrobium sp.]